MDGAEVGEAEGELLLGDEATDDEAATDEEAATDVGATGTGA